MNVLTPSGYVNIEDLNIGDQIIAYDLITGDIIINHLEKKELWTLDQYEDEYGPDTYVYHESGSLVYNQSGSIQYDCQGNILYDEEGNVLYYESSSVELDCDGNPVYDHNSYHETVPGPLIRTKEEIYSASVEDRRFYRINNTWDLYKNQSIWANMNVVHAKDLQVGDIVYNGLDEDVLVDTIVETTGSNWWRLVISGDHSYIADNLTLHNASRYWVGGGGSKNWNASPTNWSSTSGGPSGSTAPGPSDDAFFDASGSLSNTDSNISVATSILTLTISSSYTAAMSHSAALTVNGNITLGENYQIYGTTDSSNNIIFYGSNITLKTNNRTLPIGMQFNAGVANPTQWISGSLTLLGSVTSSTVGLPGLIATRSANLDTITCGGYCSSVAGSPTYVKTKIIVTTGSITRSNVTLGNGYTYFDGGLVVAPTGSVTILNLASFGNSGSNPAVSSVQFITASGTITAQALELNSGNFSGQGTTIDSQGVAFQTLYAQNSAQFYCITDLTVTGLITLATSATIQSNRLIVGGGITVNGETFGGGRIVLNGGTWSGNGSTINNNVDLSGSITLGSNTRFGGTAANTLRWVSGSPVVAGSTLNIGGSCILQTEPVVWNNLLFGTTNTTVLSSSLNVSGLTNISAATTLNTASLATTASLNVRGGITTNQTLGGSAKVVLIGGSWIGNATGYSISNNTDISGSITISGANVRYGGTATNALRWLTGSITTAGSTFNIGGSGILDVQPITWNNLTFAAGNTTTLSSSLNVSGLSLTVGGTTLNTASLATTASLICGGGLSTTASISGNATITLAGGTWRGYSVVGGIIITNNVDISGSITVFGSNVRYGGVSRNTLRWLTGSVTTAGSTLRLDGSCTLDTGPVVWDSATINASDVTAYLSSSFYLNGNFIIDSNATFLTAPTGSTVGWNVGGLYTFQTVGRTMTLQAGATFTVRNIMQHTTQPRTANLVITSNNATTRAFLTLLPGATSNTNANFTRIDASQGRPIRTFNGTINNCVNIEQLNDLRTNTSTFVRTV